jgi:hypothetical protein
VNGPFLFVSVEVKMTGNLLSQTLWKEKEWPLLNVQNAVEQLDLLRNIIQRGTDED